MPATMLIFADEHLQNSGGTLQFGVTLSMKAGALGFWQNINENLKSLLSLKLEFIKNQRIEKLNIFVSQFEQEHLCMLLKKPPTFDQVGHFGL